ncbi:MAG: hypothetical protein LAP39_00560 [Acidobacteriia bacterium]|nr:hypothetical protein [Terriglobia bacterium]
MPAAGNKSKKALLAEYLREENLSEVTETEWSEIAARLAPISETYLRRLLADTAIPVAQPYAGVRQKSFDDLERSLLELEAVYREAKEAGNRVRAQQCRNAVIQAKDHARLAARSPKTSPEKKAQKEEMIQWMLVWLDDPGVFPAWVKLRKQKM